MPDIFVEKLGKFFGLLERCASFKSNEKKPSSKARNPLLPRFSREMNGVPSPLSETLNRQSLRSVRAQVILFSSTRQKNAFAKIVHCGVVLQPVELRVLVVL